MIKETTMNNHINPIHTVLFAFIYALGLTPRRWSSAIADAIGVIWYALDKGHREIVHENMARVYGSEKSGVEIRNIARRCFGHIARIPFEMGWSLRRERQDFMRHCRMTGLEHLRRAHAKGKGVLILTLHIGNWELLSTSYIASGFNVSVVYRPLDFEPVDKFILDYRSRHGAQPISKKKSMRRILNALAQNDCVGILLDQTAGLKAGVRVNFFGHPAWTNKGMALMALKTQAPVLTTFLVRNGLDYEVHIGPEIPLVRTGNKEDDIRLNTLRYNQALEEIIRKYPEQWLWMHRRWKERGKKRKIISS